MIKSLALALALAAAAPALAVTELPIITFSDFTQGTPGHGTIPKLVYYKNEDVTKTTVVVTRVPHTTTTTVTVNVPTQVVTKVPVLDSHGHQVVIKGVPQFKNVVTIVQVPTQKQVTTTTYTNVSTYSTHTTPKAELYSTNGTSTALSSPAVKFNYLVPVAPWAASALAGTQSAYLTLDAVSTSPVTLLDGELIEPFDSGTISFIRTTPVVVRNTHGRIVGTPKSNLLTVSFTNATLFGQNGASTFTLAASTPTSTISFSSDFLNFTNSVSNDFSLVFNAALPALKIATTTPTAYNQTNVTGAHTLTTTRASTTGQFGASAVPEPAMWGMMVAGFAMIGLRRRGKLVVVAA